MELELEQTIYNHQNGNLDEAEKGYLELIKENPDDGKLNFLLGTLYLQNGKPDISSAFLLKSVSQNPSDTKAINNLGLAYQSMGKYDDAIKLFIAAIKLDENYLSAYNNLGICYQLIGDYNNAVEVLKSSLLLKNDDDETNYNLGAVLHNQGLSSEALNYYEKAVELNPEYIEALYNIALIYISENEFNKSKVYLEKAYDINPESFDINFNLGFVNEQLLIIDKAKYFYSNALKLNPYSPELNFNFGNVYKSEKNWEKAECHYLTALGNKKEAEIFNNLGFVQHKQGKFLEASANYKSALELNSSYYDAKTNYGASLLELGQIEDAICQYKEVIDADNSNPSAHFNYSIALLLSGNLKEGWSEYEWRFLKGNLDKPKFVKPEWQGEDLSGKTILVHDEQGAGDSVQFIRFLKILKDLGATVAFKCRKMLMGLYKNLNYIDEIIELTENCSFNIDYEISLLSIPHVLNIGLTDIPVFEDYLNVDKILNDKWNKKIDAGNKYKIGLVWQGNPDHEYDFKRSCEFENFKQILNYDNAVFYNLQFGNSNQDLKNNSIIYLSKDNILFEDTAAIVSQMDLIITVDTATAHIAGALGKKTWVLLSKIPDWRWLMDRSDSPWYPSVKLFRQKEIGNWDTVFEMVKNELDNLLNTDDDKQISEFLDKKIEAFQLHVNGEIDKAEQIYKELLNLYSDDTELLFWLASLYNSKKDFNSSIKYYEQAVLINPNYYEAVEALAYIYEETKNYEKSVKNFEILLSQNKNDFQLLLKTGEIYGRLRNFELAEKYLKRAYQIDKSNFNLLNILGLVLQKGNKLQEAKEMFFKAEEISPLTPGIYLNIGNTYLLEKNFDNALRNLDEAIKLEHNFKEAHLSKAIALLINEKYQQGWQELLWGLKRPDKISKNNSVPIWKPVSGNGERVLVYSEQGAGDIIQFSRYLRLIKELDYNIIFVCPKPLSYLYKDSEYIAEIIDTDIEDYNDINYDYYVPLLALAGVFNTNTNSIPECSDVLNLKNIPKSEFSINPDKLNVGFVWAGNPDNGNDHIRSTELLNFEKLFYNSDVEFYSLQKDAGSEIDIICSRYENVHNISNHLNNYADTADAINQLDLIITIETGVAHLAGTLGKETWTLLPYFPDWRWLLNRDDSPWYSSMKLFRQENPGDWKTLFEKLENEFVIWIEKKKNKQTDLQNVELNAEKQRLIARGLLENNNVEEAKNILMSIPKNKKTASVYFDLGYCFHLQNNLPYALENYNKTLELNSNDFNALNNIGIILKDLMHLEDAANSLILSLKLNSNNPIALNNLGIIFDLKGDFQTAIELFQNAIKLNEKYEEAYLNISNCFDSLGKSDEALASINQALELNPNYVDAHFNKSLILLKNGLFKEGLEEYEWRLKKKEYPNRNYGMPFLNTFNINGKKVLVFDEQGYGDTLNFARYLNMLKKLGAVVYLECHSALAKLMKNCMGVDAVFERGAQDLSNLQHDYQIPLLSLPKFFETNLENIPHETPYINIDEKVNQYWRGWFSEYKKPKIGIVWEGKKPLNNIHRASSLKQFSSLTEMREYQFFSLQIGDAAKQNEKLMAEYNIIDMSKEIKDFSDTAAIINNLDLVISVDTSVAHLSGAIGKKVWTLLSYKADWRWFKNTDESPWYPTMKLFRQKKFNDWQELLLRVKIQLQKELTQFLD